MKRNSNNSILIIMTILLIMITTEKANMISFQGTLDKCDDYDYLTTCEELGFLLFRCKIETFQVVR